MGLAAAVATAISSIVEFIGGGIAAGAVGLGIGAETAAGIGAIAGPAIFGAGTGAALSAATGGKPLTGAITGGLGGGLIGAFGGAGGALTGALGGSQTASGALLGAAAGAIGSGVTGGSPLQGAVAGGLGGAATGALSGMAGGGAGVSPELVNADGSIAVPPTPPMLNSAGDVVTNAAGNAVYPTPQLAQAAAGNALLSQPGAVGYEASLNPQSALSAGSGSGGLFGGNGGGGLLSNPSLALGALSAASSYFNKPKQGGYTIPTAQSAVSGNYNQPLSPAGTFLGATPVVPAVPNYYTYGAIPGGANYFTNNNLAAYGFAKGGALRAANENDEQEFRTGSGNHRVRGPGTETSDSIPARLSTHEYVLDARDVRLIGGGSVERGSDILDRERKKLNRGGGGALSRLGRAA